MDSTKLLLRLQRLVKEERSKHKDARGVIYSKRVINLVSRIFSDYNFTKLQVHKVTKLSNNFLKRFVVSGKESGGKFSELKVKEASRPGGKCGFLSFKFEVETRSGLQIKNISVSELAELEKHLSC